MIAGIVIARMFSVALYISVVMLSMALIVWVLFEFIVRKKFIMISGHGSTLFYFLIIIFSSVFIYSMQEWDLDEDLKSVESLKLLEWEEIEIEGEIIESGKSRSGRPVYTVEVNETTIADGVSWREDYRIRLYADKSDIELLSAGDKLQAEIRIFQFPEQRNPHEFDYGGWLKSQGISAHGEVLEILNSENSIRPGFGHLRTNILNRIDNILNEKEASLAKALLLGYKDDLTPENQKQFSRAGLSHIMAVSGLHVGFVVAPFWFLIPFLWRSEKRKWLGIIFLTVLLFFYAGLTGFSASVSRASLMAWLLTYGRLFHKVRNSINITAVAAIILLLIEPDDLFEPGFQLSFSAVFIILLVMPQAKKIIPGKYQFGWKGGLITIIMVSAVVQLGLFPILIYYFGEFSVIGPLSNALVIPILTFVVPIGLVLVLFNIWLPEIVVMPVEIMLVWIQSVAQYTGGSQFSFITINDFSWILFLIWICAVLSIASAQIPKIRWKIVVCLLVALNLFMVERIIDKSKPRTMDVTFLDVGQGDAIYIKTPNNKHLLVDTGRWTPGTDSGSDTILPFLEYLNVKKLDAVFLSHPHADHIGGVEEIISQIPVDTIYQSDADYDSKLFKSFMKEALDKNIPVRYPSAGDLIHVDPSVRLYVLGPENNSFSSNPNNRSLVFKIVYGESSILFTGDAESEQEALIVKKYGEFLDSDIYKVAHHASNTSSSDEFLNHITPQISVASLAFKNRFGHPGQNTVNRLHQNSNIQHYTSLAGAFVYRSDGTSFQNVNWRD